MQPSDTLTAAKRPPLLPGNGQPGLVSVIVPMYNRAGLIGGMLDSVKRQSYRPIQVIVVDDGSSDDSEERALRWATANQEPNFSIRIISQPNSGAPSARNFGLTECSGEFIQFFDSDDRMVIHKLADQVAALTADNSTGFAFSRVSAASMSDMTAVLAQLNALYSPAPFIPVPSATTSGLIARGVFRRWACREVGWWNESLARYQDWEYSVRYIAKGFKTLASKEIGFVTGLHDGPRIKDANDQHRNTLELVPRAAESARQAIDEESPGWNMALVKIAQLYSFGLVAALRSNSSTEALDFMQQIRELTPATHPVRIKNEIYFQLATRVGARRVDVLGKALSKWRTMRREG